MKRTKHLITVFALIFATFAWGINPAKAQGSNKIPNTKSPMVYHNGDVITGTIDVYLIFYGCWDAGCGSNGNSDTVAAVETFAQSIGGTTYFQLNRLYPNEYGQIPSGGAIYGGTVIDSSYAHGTELTIDDIHAIVADHISNFDLPQDPVGIYVVISSADVGATAAGLCTTVGAPPLHGQAYALGIPNRFAFLGNPNRCPAIAGPQFIAANGSQIPTPNNDFAADVIASDMARALENTITNPYGHGWYDKYNLETADKCWGTFGTTYTTSNGARANVRWYGRDYLIQQNWVNDKRAGCAMQLSR